MDKTLYFNHPFNSELSFLRLCKEVNKYGKLIIGFDFDNTIFDYHNNGGNYSEVISLLQECKNQGHVLCLYTSESDSKKLEWKIDYCKHFNIEPNYVNESPVLREASKPFFNILLDDRAGLEESYMILKKVVKYVNTKLNKSGEE